MTGEMVLLFLSPLVSMLKWVGIICCVGIWLQRLIEFLLVDEEDKK